MVEVCDRLTEEEFLTLPDDGRKYELVNGEATAVSTGVLHEAIGYRLMRLLGVLADALGVIAGSSAGYRMANGNIRSPGVSFTRFERLRNGEPPAGFGEGAPDLCVEIISPSETYREISAKIDEYLRSGAREVWIVDPGDGTVSVHNASGGYRILHGEDRLTATDIVPGFECTVADVFAVPVRRP